LGALAGLAALVLILVGRSQRPLIDQRQHCLLGPSIWLGQLLARRGPIALGLARVDRRLSSTGRVARALSPHLPGATLARLGADTLLWFTQDPPVRATLLAAASGTLKELCTSDTATHGALAFETGLPSPQWRRVFDSVSNSASADSLKLDRAGVMSALERDLTGLDVGLQLVHADKASASTFGAQNSNRALRQVILDAVRGYTGFKRVGETEVFLLAPGGTPAAMLVVPASKERHRPWKPVAAALMQRAELMLTLLAAASSAPRRVRPQRNA
jgi:hypothetical protein